MKKRWRIGIVTIPDETNYGNRLQNYALSYVLQKRYGCHVVSLVTHKRKVFLDGNYVLWAKEQTAKVLGILFPKAAERRFGSSLMRWIRFERWNKKIPSRHFYGTDRLPSRLNKEYDFFFAGSDQIWNYHFASEKFYNYFLQFAKPEKRVAAAASFGVGEIPKRWEKVYRKGLSGFEKISVREEQGKQIVQKLIQKEVPVLPDPVFLLDQEEWIRAVKNRTTARCIPKEPYVFQYCLGENTSTERIDGWAQKNGYRICRLGNPDTPKWYSAGPAEFLYLLTRASLVYSDSFHGTAFAILFSRPCIVAKRKGKDSDMQSRLTTLLDKFGLQNRWEEVLPEEEYLHCDYSKVPGILQQERKKFTEYLDSVFQER